MKKFFANKNNNLFIFENEELAHFNVLRCKVGEQIICFGNDEFNYICEVQSVTKKQAIAKIISKEKNTKNPKKLITIFQGLVKGEKTDLIVQKLTELGVTNLFLFESEFSVAKINNNKIDRLNKISLEACKQCGRSIPLKISEMLSFNQMISKLNQFDLVLFANEKNRGRFLNADLNKFNIAIIVGGEGGFSDKEIQQINMCGAINFGLGERILRAETACIAMSAIVGHIIDV